ncbi:MAG: DUF1244 domain-containing protein [Acidimicrobiales bacterium]|nr:DUF1244 domain-containing protein [Hyphomonadaceae bacterium]RZV44195.1 MAG: DUF1244 domain-containing protein [Acidimicrobiales bacterium]
MSDNIDQATQDKLDAAVMRRLIAHLDDRKNVQNIDLMILADFCRNCLGKWYKNAADDLGVDMSDEAAKERIYGMPYTEWKKQHQLPASQEQLDKLDEKKSQK